MDPLKDAIDIFVSQSALAKVIGCDPQVVNNWLRRGRVPADYCPAIERATGGRVTCEALRPDIDWADRRYLPDGDQSNGVTINENRKAD